jgi:hypothetical protein
MKAARFALALAGFAGALLAQDTSPAGVSAKPSAATRQARHRLDLIATRAIANFRSLESIEANLNDLGLALHPQLVMLRLRIEGALNAAEDAIDAGDLTAASESLDQAEALLGRLASQLGGA